MLEGPWCCGYCIIHEIQTNNLLIKGIDAKPAEPHVYWFQSSWFFIHPYGIHLGSFCLGLPARIWVSARYARPFLAATSPDQFTGHIWAKQTVQNEAGGVGERGCWRDGSTARPCLMCIKSRVKRSAGNLQSPLSHGAWKTPTCQEHLIKA